MEQISFPNKKYQIIYADPPWDYKTKNPTCKISKQPETCSVNYYYSTMSFESIVNFPVNKISDENSVLFLWATVPMIQEAFAVMKAWGFKYKTMITWEKTNRDCMGYWFRVCTEHLLVGIKGDIRSFRSMARTLYSCPRGRHSQKPEYFRELIDVLFPEVDKIELFSRAEKKLFELKNWELWGNEIKNDLNFL